MKKILILLIIFILSFILLKSADNYFSETTKVYISKQADNLASNAIKDVINQTVVPFIDIEEILYIKYKDEKVETVIVNTKIVNKIMAKASEVIDELLNNDFLEKELNTLSIPLGMLISNSFFANVGPCIKIHLKPLGAYNADVYTNISSYGINNSLIEVYLEVIIDIVALIPLQHENVRVSSKVYLVSQIIQGTVPNYYYGNKTNVDYIPDND